MKNGSLMASSSQQCSSRPLGRLRSPASVSVRPLCREDIPALRDGFANGVAAETTRWTFPRSLPSMLGWFDELTKTKDRDSLAIRVDGNLPGFAA
jgi:hypothetical protein